MKSHECRLYDCSRNKLSNRTNLYQPIPANLLSRFRNICFLQIFDGDFIYSLLCECGKAQRFDPLENVDSKLFDNFHHIGEFQGVEFLIKINNTALDVS